VAAVEGMQRQIADLRSEIQSLGGVDPSSMAGDFNPTVGDRLKALEGHATAQNEHFGQLEEHIARELKQLSDNQLASQNQVLGLETALHERIDGVRDQIILMAGAVTCPTPAGLNRRRQRPPTPQSGGPVMRTGPRAPGTSWDFFRAPKATPARRAEGRPGEPRRKARLPPT
jgi:hypothetical protein